IFEAAIDSTAGRLQIRMRPGASACVIAASGGYPGKYASGLPITGLDSPHSRDTVVFHSGTASRDNAVVTAGGRVLAVTSAAETAANGDSPLRVALANAYSALGMIAFEGMQYRRDIGWRALRDGL
ncbi:MAG TPA: phosphoribosylglycinamide synthetase C domain-containing protein, partial [Acidobacteriaceae bacterium]|nr:phosphoribosylglycinamide synthetase C domain-containing protein [Acidobacteriaceae bacterium]